MNFYILACSGISVTKACSSPIEKQRSNTQYQTKPFLSVWIVGYYHSKMGCETLDIGKMIVFEHLSKEMDVYAVYGNRVVVGECKGYNYPPITKADLEIDFSNFNERHLSFDQ